MKRVVAVLLAVFMLFGLVGCGAPIETKEFSSAQEMQDFLQGVWKTTTMSGEDAYMFFIDGKVITYGFSTLQFDSYREEVKELAQSSYKAYAEMSATEKAAEWEKSWLADAGDECGFDYEKGEVTYGEQGVIYVGEDSLFYNENTYEKVADTPTYEAAGITQQFTDVYDRYRITQKVVKDYVTSQNNTIVDKGKKEEDGKTTHSFTYFDGNVSAHVIEKDGHATQIGATAIINRATISDEDLAAATCFVMTPMAVCTPFNDVEDLVTSVLNVTPTTDETNNTYFQYKAYGWQFVLVISDYFVMAASTPI